MPGEKESLDTRYPRIQFRAGKQLEQELLQRDAGSVDVIAKRDLERYYSLLQLTLLSMPPFSEEEAIHIVNAFRDGLIRPETASLLWANVEEEIRERTFVLDTQEKQFVERLRELTPFECMVILDAVERAWGNTYRVENMRERVRLVGLVRSEK